MLFTYWIKNCQRRALIIEKLTESKEQFFFSLSLSLLFIVCCLHRLKATLRPVNTIISILKTSRAVFFFGERTRSTQRAAASSVTRAKMKVSPSCGTSPPMGCNKRRRERERESEDAVQPLESHLLHRLHPLFVWAGLPVCLAASE